MLSKSAVQKAAAAVTAEKRRAEEWPGPWVHIEVESSMTQEEQDAIVDAALADRPRARALIVVKDRDSE